MDEIRTIINISHNYYIARDYTFDEDYDEHYRICHEAATNFINTSEVFSELKPEEIIKVFTGIELKNNIVLNNSLFNNHYRYYRLNSKIYEKLLKVNKEMLVALIKAINDKKIPHAYLYYFDDNGVLGMHRGVPDVEMIRLYRILLEYNNFSLDNLNIKNIINDIRPSMTKRAI